MSGWEIFYLVAGLFAGGTIGGLGMALLAVGNRSAAQSRRYRRWETDHE
jgi:hypothetical protein